jgi:hypothetical protein
MNNLPAGLTSYEEIYKLSCRESNMPPHPLQVLPALTFREPDPQLHRPVESVPVEGTFNFEGLDLRVQFRILQMLLCFYGEKVHVLCRLDPHLPPSLESGDLGHDPENLQLIRRFHIGDRPVSLTGARLPQDLLAPLLVCRIWLFWGIHLFYGENTFAFSSFGE